MNQRGWKKTIKRFMNDSLWCICGLVLMNVVAQFVVYPSWNRYLGSDAYGDVLFLISLMNTVAVSMGVSCNYSRMVESASTETKNTHYSVLLVAISVLALPYSQIIRLAADVEISLVESLLYALLMIVTMWRYYADIEYRLYLNYKGYFVYYLTISAGYLFGIFLFRQTKLWPLALLPGEILGLIRVYWKGRVLRLDEPFSVPKFLATGKTVLQLFSGEVISNLVFNGDRIVLKLMIGGTAVTTYYLASLLGKTMSLITTPLNSVIIGYLTRYSGKLTTKMMHMVSGIAALVSVAGALSLTGISCVLIHFLYPGDFVTAKPYFLIANFSQIFYFAAGVIVVALMRFAGAKNQVIVNTVYGVTFFVLSIPMTWFLGLDGFCASVFAACLVRLLVALTLGYLHARKEKRGESENDY